MNTGSIRFFAVEKITFIYILITTLFLVAMPDVYLTSGLISFRLIIVGVIISFAWFNAHYNWWGVRLMRYAFVGAMLSYWYPDTYDMNRMLPNQDYLLAGWEQSLFGCQPALEFARLVPQQWFSEILHMGYFSYYPIIICTSLYFFFLEKKKFEHFFFVVICSFFLYYLIYIAFPVAGPQYYFPAIGKENLLQAIFPPVGTYFHQNNSLLIDGDHFGFFYQLVENTQQVGERPTAAFPSSHVGISTLIVILILHYRQFRIFFALLPFYLALVMATVYIQAHYLIDVLAGLVSSYLFYRLSNRIYELFTRKYYGLSELKTIFMSEAMRLKLLEKRTELY